MINKLEEALDYRNNHSFSVIPVDENKQPLIKWMPYQQEKATEDQIKQWWSKWPDANIGIVTGKISNLAVIDIDTEEGTKAIEDYLPDSVSIPTAETPKGGRHLYFACPDPPLPNNSRTIPGCDLRCEGGYVVAPPSKGINGNEYRWLDGLNMNTVEPPALPRSYIERVTQDQGARRSINDKSCIYSTVDNEQGGAPMFVEGRRDEDLFHIAHTLVRGGMPAQYALQVLEMIAKSCSPPFPEHEVPAKIESALRRAERRDASLSQDVKEFILSSNGVFLSTDVVRCLQLSSREDQKNLSKILSRFCDQGLIERHGNKHGCFRVVDSSCEAIDYRNASNESIDLHWPFEIEQYVKILPRNIIVIAGVSNSGKTAFLLNFTEMNMNKFNVYYFSSEMAEIELRDRLSKFERPLESWRFHPIERSSNFADVIKPDDINIIDFLEIHDEFWKVGGMIKEIYDKLRKGIAVIALQKDPMKELGRGATGSLEKARLYMTMDSRTLKIVKGKNWAQQGVNPNGLELSFKLIQGCHFVLEKDWHKSDSLTGSGYKQTTNINCKANARN